MGVTKLKYKLQLIDFSKNKAIDIPLTPCRTVPFNVLDISCTVCKMCEKDLLSPTFHLLLTEDFSQSSGSAVL